MLLADHNLGRVISSLPSIEIYAGNEAIVRGGVRQRDPEPVIPDRPAQEPRFPQSLPDPTVFNPFPHPVMPEPAPRQPVINQPAPTPAPIPEPQPQPVIPQNPAPEAASFVPVAIVEILNKPVVKYSLIALIIGGIAYSALTIHKQRN